MIRADRGDTVKVHYTGRLADGTVFDASPEDRPLLFILGKNEVIDGFDRGVEGMRQGESRTFTVPFDQAYGPREERYVEEVPLAQIPPEVRLQVGRQLEITDQQDRRLLVLITALSEETVTLDGNHPLAGHDLTFEVELLEVKKQPVG